jgi:hypothetical protein
MSISRASQRTAAKFQPGPDLVSRDGFRLIVQRAGEEARDGRNRQLRAPTCVSASSILLHVAKESPLSPEGKVRSLGSEYGQNVATYFRRDIVMADVISGNGKIILDSSGVEDSVFYWLTISDEPGKLVAEGSITASEDLLRKVKKSGRATLALEDGPPLTLKCEGGRNGVRWVKALRD